MLLYIILIQYHADKIIPDRVRIMVVNPTFNNISLIMAVSFIGEGN
jgi:hypothetical protein